MNKVTTYFKENVKFTTEKLDKNKFILAILLILTIFTRVKSGMFLVLFFIDTIIDKKESDKDFITLYNIATWGIFIISILYTIINFLN